MNSRRQFFKQMAAFAGFAALASVFSSPVLAQEKRRARGGDAAGDMPMAVPGKEVAGTLGYIEKTKDPAKHCSNCALYTKHGDKGGEVGKCAVIPGKLVKADAYCNSWAKKA